MCLNTRSAAARPTSARRGGSRARWRHSRLTSTAIAEPQDQFARAPEQLTIASGIDAGVVTLVVRGEVDIASAAVLEGKLRDAESSRPRRIVLDLAALGFIDSTGIHLLIRAQRRADANGHQLILTDVPARAKRLFGLTGIAAQFVIE
jgi:anti-anti-sigma factor